MIIEKIVSEEYKLELQQVLLSNDINWNWSTSMSGQDDINFITSQMSHGSTIINENLFNFCSGILNNFSAKTNLTIDLLCRSRVNCYYRANISEDQFLKSKHRDFPKIKDKDFYTLIYYVNDSDGDTFVFNDDELSIKEQKTPKAGDAMLIKSNDLHCAMPPKINSRRVVVVFIFTLK
jgi:hypothetical protein